MANIEQKLLENIKTDLTNRKNKLIDQLKSFANQDVHKKDNFNSGFPKFGDDEDDNAAEVAAFEGNLHLEETLETSLEMINRALKKIDDGSYGICEKCKNPIEAERLKAMPTATRCASKSCRKQL